MRARHYILLLIASIQVLLSPDTIASQVDRLILIEALLGNGRNQINSVNQLVDSKDPLIETVLNAWRDGGVYIYETEEGTRIPFILDKQTNDNDSVQGIKVVDSEILRDVSGQPIVFKVNNIVPVDTTSKLRRAIKTTLDILSLSNPDPKIRSEAAGRLAFDQNLDYLPMLEGILAEEKVTIVRQALNEAIAITQLAATAPEIKQAGIQRLGELRSINALDLVRQFSNDTDANTARAARIAVADIELYLFWGNVLGTFFRGLSLGAVLLVATLGLAITFGLMGVINMAHGEMIMVGAYAAYVTQNVFVKLCGATVAGYNSFFLPALVAAFISAAIVGLLLERCVIQFLYKRPLESLLATWGVSLLLQQIFRSIFGAANVQVSSPNWLSGSFIWNDVLFAYNRLFVIGFAVFILVMTYVLERKTNLGLLARAVMQNRNMAACMGVRTNRINMLIFAFGSGLAGLAGACLSQIGNVGPSLGQSYIVDCFMIVVLGGVGNLLGTAFAALGVGVADQVLQPFLGAVLGKITVLTCIILFLQWRPSGLFVSRNRSL